MEVKLNKTTDNPFFGMHSHLKLFQDGGKSDITFSMLDKCWQEVYVDGVPDLQRKQLFFSLLFSIGDITARQHNIYRGRKVDSGGNAQRDNFRTIMLWLKNHHKVQYNRFLHTHLFNEFTTFDNLLAARVKTKKKTDKPIGVVDMIGASHEWNELAQYIASIIKGKSSFDKYLVAKYLTRPRLSKRQNHKKMLDETKFLMKKKEALLLRVSEMCDFPYQKRHGYIHFTGYYEWRKPFIGSMESVLFSSREIGNLDRHQFIEWLDKIPATARLRVRNRLMDKDNKLNPRWGEMGNWFLEWEGFKKVKQAEKRVIEEKVRQGDHSEETLQELKEVTKAAKVTVGANDFTTLFGEIITAKVDEVKIEPFLDKVNLPYNTLVFVDDSGSMRATRSQKYGFSAFDMASFIATIALMKNPSDVGRSMMGLFSQNTRIIRTIDAVRTASNNLLNGKVTPVKMPLFEPELSFLQNLGNIRAMLLANSTYNATYLSSIPDSLHSWSQGDDAKIELLQEFPVWTIITDGNFNSMSSPESSLNEFMYKCQTYFGFKPYIVAIDVGRESASASRFTGIENFIYVLPNPSQIEQFLTNFKDIDVMDVFTPLLSIFRSNRYDIVRENVL